MVVFHKVATKTNHGESDSLLLPLAHRQSSLHAAFSESLVRRILSSGSDVGIRVGAPRYTESVGLALQNTRALSDRIRRKCVAAWSLVRYSRFFFELDERYLKENAQRYLGT